jgi:hypothetical protein
MKPSQMYGEINTLIRDAVQHTFRNTTIKMRVFIVARYPRLWIIKLMKGRFSASTSIMEVKIMYKKNVKYIEKGMHKSTDKVSKIWSRKELWRTFHFISETRGKIKRKMKTALAHSNC